MSFSLISEVIESSISSKTSSGWPQENSGRIRGTIRVGYRALGISTASAINRAELFQQRADSKHETSVVLLVYWCMIVMDRSARGTGKADYVEMFVATELNGQMAQRGPGLHLVTRRLPMYKPTHYILRSKATSQWRSSCDRVSQPISTKPRSTEIGCLRGFGLEASD